MISISAPNGRRQPVHPPAPVRDLGPRAIQRLMALKREEQEQELEDYENLKMTERRILEQTFFSVKFEVADLDGLSWASPNGRYMLQRWYTSQVPAIREQLDLSASDNDEIDYDEYMDCEPPPSSASDSTIIPDREDIPSVDIEPPSPPPTARTTHIPPPLVWPTAHSSAPSLRSTEIHTPRSPRSPSTPLSPGALRRCRGRAYAHALRRTSTHRVFSVPTCSSPLREKTQLGGCDAVSLGHTDIDPTPPATTAEEMPEPQRFTSMLIGLGDIPIPPPLERTFNEYPEGSWTPDEIIYHSLDPTEWRRPRDQACRPPDCIPRPLGLLTVRLRGVGRL
ncbi:hypothetical protein C8Q72DRAFT_108213 [Fomitopsis betulina]|nr:hypothetical protein C8Q72DRAFT_108213 [Fomitopsis betulina]